MFHLVSVCSETMETGTFGAEAFVFWLSKCYCTSGLLVAQTDFRGSVQSTRAHFTPCYSPHTAPCLMYQWRSAQLQRARKTVRHQMSVFWTTSCESTPTRRLVRTTSHLICFTSGWCVAGDPAECFVKFIAI